MAPAVQIETVSKRFRLFHEKYTSVKERAIHFGRIPFEDFWALKDINLEIGQGETVGLLGHNGSGKSTLLKCIAGILQPTEGQIRVVGRVAALLELGAGFHPELSGRDNVFLNASLLGLKRKEVERRFDDIVAFAELEPHIDQQVKYYSSGMYVRLGFAVAVNMDPDILLVDEVLSVGDELFQRKCIDRVRQIQREGRTIIFVTHSVDQIRQICDRAAVLDQGDMVACGTPGEAVRSYREHLLLRQRYAEAERLPIEPSDPAVVGAPSEAPLALLDHEDAPSFEIRIASVRFEYPHCETSESLLSGEPLTVHIGYEAVRPVDDLVVIVSVYDAEGRLLFGWNTDRMGLDLGLVVGRGEIRFSIRSVPLLDGTYPVTIGMHTHDEATVYDWREQQDRFEVMSPSRAVGVLQVDVDVTVDREAPAGQAGVA
jgi:ABC-2 type transport system ATP-binding protein